MCGCVSHWPCTGLPKSPKLLVKVTVCMCVCVCVCVWCVYACVLISENNTNKKYFQCCYYVGYRSSLVFAHRRTAGGEKSIFNSCFCLHDFSCRFLKILGLPPKRQKKQFEEWTGDSLKLEKALNFKIEKIRIWLCS